VVPASASVLLRHSGATPPVSADDVRRLVAGAVSGLLPEAVAVVMQPVVSPTPNAAAQLAQLGPLSVARSSATQLRIGFAAVAALNLCLVVGLLLLWARLRKLLRASSRSKASESET
jgi:type III secretory pathway lipoprotein EscJ